MTPFFGPTASWNQKVVGPAPGYEDYVHRLMTWGCGTKTLLNEQGKFGLRFRGYSIPIYDVAEATTTIRVYQVGWAAAQQKFGNVGVGVYIPWNPSWKPGTLNDRTMAVVNYKTGQVWEIWVAYEPIASCLDWPWQQNSRAGVWNFNQYAMGAASVHTYNNLHTAVDGQTVSVRGMGINKLALVTRADEVLSGRIEHALELTISNPMFGPLLASPPLGNSGTGAGTTKGFWMKPATRLEHLNPATLGMGNVTTGPVSDAERAKTVPSGMRFALWISDAGISDWLDTRGYKGARRETARIFAVALRDYGAIVAETGGYGIGIETDGFMNPKTKAKWLQLGLVDDNSDYPESGFLDGLITESRLYVA